MLTLFNIILPVFLVIGAGYLSTRSGLMKQAQVDGILAFAQNFAFPCLLFGAIAQLDLGAAFDLPLLFSFYGAASICFGLGILGARAIGRAPQDAVVIGFCCLFSNSLMLGLPITERAFGTEALAGNYAIISIHAPYCYVLGVMAMETVRAREGEGDVRLLLVLLRILKQLARNNIVVALGLGFVVNLSGLSLPAVLDETLTMVGRAGLPAALFGVGGVLVQYKIEGDWRLIGLICVTGLLVHPGLAWAFGSFAGLEAPAFRSLVLTASVAPGINTYIFANIYGVGKRSAASALLISTAMCLFTVWFWLSLLT